MELDFKFFNRCISRPASPFLSNRVESDICISLRRCCSPHYIVPHSSCSCQHCQLGNCSECNNLHRRACCFVMAFGVTPNILCAEIIPTSIHGLCIAICALTFWKTSSSLTHFLSCSPPLDLLASSESMLSGASFLDTCLLEGA